MQEESKKMENQTDFGTTNQSVIAELACQNYEKNIRLARPKLIKIFIGENEIIAESLKKNNEIDEGTTVKSADDSNTHKFILNH